MCEQFLYHMSFRLVALIILSRSISEIWDVRNGPWELRSFSTVELGCIRGLSEIAGSYFEVVIKR